MTTPKQIERWRTDLNEPAITDSIRNFGEWAYQNQYLPGRQKYGPKFIGLPTEQMKEEIADLISYINVEEHKQRYEARERQLLYTAIPLLREIIQGQYIPTNINGIKGRIEATLTALENLYVDDPNPSANH